MLQPIAFAKQAIATCCLSWTKEWEAGATKIFGERSCGRDDFW